MNLNSSISQSHSAFNKIIPIFQERSLAGGGLEKMEMFPTSLPRAQWENVSFSGPSVSDFISDVELAARRTLTIEELAYFNRYYKTSSVIVCETEAEEFDNALNTHIASFPEDQQSFIFAMDSKVREKVGTALISSGMGSLIEYLTPSGRVN